MGDDVIIACYLALDMWNNTTVNASTKDPAL